MARQLTIDFEGFDTQIVASLLEDDEPTCSELIWKDAEQPFRLWLSHTTSTGDFILARARPEREPQLNGTQASPLGSTTTHLSNLGPGAIVYAGNKFIAINYGPDNTEPIAAPGPIVARAEDLDAIYAAGRYVWECHKKHTLVTALVSRKDG